jgi:hypothetical protein
LRRHTATADGGGGQQLYVVWALQGTDSWQTMHMEQTVNKFNGNIIRKKSTPENGEVFSQFKTENK